MSQVHDLQATSVAVWDLAESVRSSDLEGGAGIVSDLDSLSETMKTLATEMTKFFARVDGDIDGYVHPSLSPFPPLGAHQTHNLTASST